MGRTLLYAWALVLSPFAVAAAQDDLPGAYYYKEAVTAAADGIGGSGVLPTVKTDPKRALDKITAAADEWKRGSIDAPTLGFGATGPKGQEVAAGLTWARVKDASGNFLWTDHAAGSDMGNKANQIVLKAGTQGGLVAKVGDDASAWQVVDATTGQAVSDLNALQGIKVNLVNGGAVLAGKAAVSLVPDKAFLPYAQVAGASASLLNAANPTFHLFPGQSFQMNVLSEKAGQLKLSVAGLGANGQLSPAGFVGSFNASNFAPGVSATWNRLSAINLGGTEKMAADAFSKLATSTQAVGMQWLSGNLLGQAGKLLPFNPTSIFTGGKNLLSVAKLALGKLQININPMGAIGGDLGFDLWILQLAMKSYQDTYGASLGATDPASIYFEFAFHFPPKIHFGGGAPKGALVFYLTHLGISNGNGTCIVKGNPAAPAGQVLAWISFK